MPQAMRLSADREFLPALGYERNPVAIRYNTVAKLLAVTTSGWISTATSGAKELRRRFRVHRAGQANFSASFRGT